MPHYIEAVMVGREMVRWILKERGRFWGEKCNVGVGSRWLGPTEVKAGGRDSLMCCSEGHLEKSEMFLLGCGDCRRNSS